MAGYEHITGDRVRTQKKRNLVATAYRVQGDEFLPLVQRWFAATGTATNLLGELRSRPPSDAAPPLAEKPVGSIEETPAGMDDMPPGGHEPVLGLTHSEANHPMLDRTSRRRHDRRPANPDVAGFFDGDDPGKHVQRSPTDEAISR